MDLVHEFLSKSRQSDCHTHTEGVHRQGYSDIVDGRRI